MSTPCTPEVLLEQQPPEPSPFSNKVLDFMFVNHADTEITGEFQDNLNSRVAAADVVFIETLGWSEEEQALYNHASFGDVDAYRFMLRAIRSSRGSNSYQEARLKAIRDSGKPVFIADVDIDSRAKKDRNSYIAASLVLRPSLAASASIIRSQITTMAKGIDERREAAIAIINANFGELEDTTRALVMYGAAHTGLERSLASAGYHTQHTIRKPAVFDYKSQVLRKLEYGIEPTREDWRKILAQNIVESVNLLRYPKSSLLRSVAQRAVADALSESDIAALNKSGSLDGNRGIVAALSPLSTELQQVIDRAVEKHKQLIARYS